MLAGDDEYRRVGTGCPTEGDKRMMRMFDPSRAQPALEELGQGLGPGVEWRVLDLHQNPNGVQPMRPTPSEEQGGESPQEGSPNLLQRLTGLFGKDDEEGTGPRVGSIEPPSSDSPLDLTEDELAYLRAAPTRAGTVILITAPAGEETTVRLWSMRHGGFSLAPTPDTETEIKES
jgi:hypothetical protein